MTVGGFRIVLESTTFGQVMAALGPGTIARTGDAGDSMARLCYRSADAKDPVCVVLESGEMGGGTFIIGFELFRAGTPREVDLDCSRMRFGEREIVVAPGFALTMPRRALLARLGPAQADSGASVHYARERTFRRPARGPGAKKGEPEEWYEENTMDLEFQGERLVWLRAWKSTSN